MREHLLDRFAVTISADVNLTMEQRIEAVDTATLFQNRPLELIDESKEVTEATKTQVQQPNSYHFFAILAVVQILIAREILNEVSITEDQVGYLVEEAARGFVEGQRSEIFAVRVL